MPSLIIPVDFPQPDTRPAGRYRPRVLITVGVSEPGGLWGTGLDLRTFAAEGARGVAVISGVALDGPDGPIGHTPVPAHAVNLHLGSSLAQSPCDGLKIGALLSEGAIKAADEALGDGASVSGPVVLAPTLANRRGQALLGPADAMALQVHLIPKATVVVLDLVSAEQITGRPTRTLREMKDACKRVLDLGARHVLITGGQLEGTPVDLLFDGSGYIDYGADRRTVEGLRGAGDVLTATLLCRMSEGQAMPEAVDQARGATLKAIDKALECPAGLRLADPMNPLCVALGRVADPVRIETDGAS